MELTLARNQDRLRTTGERLRWARTNARLSGPILAKELGITRQFLSQLETNKFSIPPAKIQKLARLLATTPQWLRDGAGMAPQWPETPLMIPEMDLDRGDLDPQRLRDADDDTVWLHYRTRREWALPASEAQRIGADRDKLIAVRVREEIAPEFKRGDIVMLDRAANRFFEDGYYGAIVGKEYMLAALRAAGDGTFLMTRRNERAQSIPTKTVKIIGSVVFSFRPRTNFSF